MKKRFCIVSKDNAEALFTLQKNVHPFIKNFSYSVYLTFFELHPLNSYRFFRIVCMVFCRIFLFFFVKFLQKMAKNEKNTIEM